jgi:hypothetical protein
MKEANIVAEPTPSDIESLVSRFGKARWIHGAAVSTIADRPFSIFWTPKGRLKMAKLHRMMCKLRVLPRRGILGRLAVHWWWARFLSISAEVHRPLLSVSERWVLVLLAETLELGRDGLPPQEYKFHLGGGNPS